MFRRLDPSTLTVPAPEDTLPGRREPMPVPERHHVLGTQLTGPFPDDTEVFYVGMGCFWGADVD